jgi:aspartyl-tRNA(Asn)/glutamyl-tRNA(Gln) amidotransferase subunit C
VSLSDSDLNRLARLARLRLDPASGDALKSQLTGILHLIEELQAVDTRGIEPLAHSLHLQLRLREDRVTEVDRRADYQAIAPQVENGLYLVPRVVE